MEYIIIILSAVLVSNIVLSQFLGICPFLGVSGRVSTAIGMSAAVLFVMTLATTVTWTVATFILAPLGITFLQTLTFILIIAALVQMVEIILKKISPPLYKALGIYLPLITTNCAVLGIALLTMAKDYNLIQGVVFTIANALGFGFAMFIFSGLREHIELMEAPEGMKGVPIALVTAGILSLAFMGFSGLV